MFRDWIQAQRRPLLDKPDEPAVAPVRQKLVQGSPVDVELAACLPPAHHSGAQLCAALFDRRSQTPRCTFGTPSTLSCDGPMVQHAECSLPTKLQTNTHILLNWICSPSNHDTIELASKKTGNCIGSHRRINNHQDFYIRMIFLSDIITISI